MKAPRCLLCASVLALGVIAGVIVVTHSSAVTLNTSSAGYLFTWGVNTNGQLGDGTRASSETPVRIDTPKASAISAGAAHTLAVFDLSDFTVRAWGDNSFGQLGDGSTASSSTPVFVRFPAEVPSYVRIRSVAAGGRHSLALAAQTGQPSSMVVYAWGDNSSGQLGFDGVTAAFSPVAIALPDEFAQLLPDGIPNNTAIAAGEAHSMALSPLGNVYAWGDNSAGQLGDGTTVSRSTPQAVSLPLPPGVRVRAIAAGARFSLALTTAGTVYAWGDNSLGQLGTGTAGGFSPTPVQVALPQGVAGTSVVAIAAGANHSLALLWPPTVSGNTLLAWGDNSFGQLGDGTTTQRATPVAVALPAGAVVTSMAAGATHSIAGGNTPNINNPTGEVEPTRTWHVFSWGDNTSRQLGDGTLTSHLTPEVIPALSSGGFVVDVAAGTGFTVATVEPTVEPHRSPRFTVTASPNPAPLGSPVTITITATLQSSGSDPAFPPTGIVSFTVGGTSRTPICGSIANTSPPQQVGFVPLNGHQFGGTATCTITGSLSGPSGFVSINAEFFGTVNFRNVYLTASTDLELTDVVPPPPTLMTPTIVVSSNNAEPSNPSPSNPSFYGQSIFFSATIGGTPPPSGTVSFLVDGSPLGGIIPITNNVGLPLPLTNSIAGSPSIAALVPGTHTVAVMYSGDAAYFPGSATFTQTVTKAGIAANLSSSVNPSDPGQPVTFTVTMSGAAPPSGCSFNFPPPPVGTGGEPPPPPPPTCPPPTGGGTGCSATDPTCTPPTGGGTGCSAADPTCTPPPPSGGGSGCSATDPTCTPPPPSGGGSGCSATDPTCTPPPPPPCPATGCAPASPNDAPTAPATTCLATDPTCAPPPPTCTGAACPPPPLPTGPPAPPSGAVTFTVDGNPIAPPVMLTDGQATTSTLTYLAPGPHTVWISYPGDANYMAVPLVGEFGLPLSQTVRFPTSITLTTGSPFVFGQPVTMTATVPQTFTACPLCNTDIPTGAIAFQEGSTLLAIQALSGAQAAVTLPPMSVGTHMITTIYSGDSLFSGSTALNSIAVDRAATAVALTSSLNPSILNQSVTFTAKLTVLPPGAGTPTGTVSFMDGGATLANMPLSASGLATFSTSALAVNAHTITAAYSGDPNFLASNGTLNQQVQYEPVGTMCAGNAGHQFLSPIYVDGSSIFKQGRTIPARFRVCDVNGISIGTPGVVSSFYLTTIIAGTASSTVQDVVGSNLPDAVFRWDPTAQQWIFNITSSNLLAGSTYVYTVGLNDGTTINFQFGLR